MGVHGMLTRQQKDKEVHGCPSITLAKNLNVGRLAVEMIETVRECCCNQVDLGQRLVAMHPQIMRDRAAAARQPHKLKVEGSNPSSATKIGSLNRR